MVLVGKINDIYLIFDPNIGMNSYRAGDNVADYFDIVENPFVQNPPAQSTELYQTIRLRQQTNSSRLLVPPQTQPDKIQWISSGSDNISLFHSAYKDFLSKTNL